MEPHPKPPSPAAVIFVDDVPRMTTFYRDALAMTTLHSDAHHVVLEIPGFQLTLHAISPPCQSPGTSYPTREDQPLKLCFPVQSLAASRALLKSHGGELWPPEREWQAPTFRACDGRDPEGNVLQLREPIS